MVAFFLFLGECLQWELCFPRTPDIYNIFKMTIPSVRQTIYSYLLRPTVTELSQQCWLKRIFKVRYLVQPKKTGKTTWRKQNGWTENAQIWVRWKLWRTKDKQERVTEKGALINRFWLTCMFLTRCCPRPVVSPRLCFQACSPFSVSIYSAMPQHPSTQLNDGELTSCRPKKWRINKGTDYIWHCFFPFCLTCLFKNQILCAWDQVGKLNYFWIC